MVFNLVGVIVAMVFVVVVTVIVVIAADTVLDVVTVHLHPFVL